MSCSTHTHYSLRGSLLIPENIIVRSTLPLWHRWHRQYIEQIYDIYGMDEFGALLKHIFEWFYTHLKFLFLVPICSLFPFNQLVFLHKPDAFPKLWKACYPSWVCFRWGWKCAPRVKNSNQTDFADLTRVFALMDDIGIFFNLWSWWVASTSYSGDVYVVDLWTWT